MITQENEIPVLDEFGWAYLRLTLEIDKHIDGYVDAYYGPPDLKASVAATKPQPPAALRDALGRLREILPGANPARQAYLIAVLRAMDCTLRILDGETIGYLDEVNRLYDISPQKVDEATFAEAHRVLGEVLPGSGDLTARLEAWRKPYELSPAMLTTALDLARVETRQRTQAFVELVEGESVAVALTNDRPWSAYNWYKGNARSLIEFNTDIPVSALGVAGLFAHEGYPGHHTEHQLKEKHLYRDRGYAEYASALLHSPSAVIAEGIATTALEIIFPDSSHYDWTVAVLLPAVGLPSAPVDELRQITEASKVLRYVSGNAAIMYHLGALDEAQTVEYIQTYALSTAQRARKSFSFITDPLFRAYTFTYTAGYALIEQATHAGDKRPLFTRLLTQPILPSQLAEM